MDTIEENAVNSETPANQPPSERIQHALQELIKSGGTQISTSQSNFIESCNELLHLPFYSEDGRLLVIQSLAQLNGNFVIKIIRKGLPGLNKVYTSKTFEDESIQLIELCVSLYLKQRNQEDGYLVSPSPAKVVDCTVDLCDTLMKSKPGEAPTQSEILLSKCLLKLTRIYETIASAKLVVIDIVNPLASVISPPNPMDTFNHVFDALKSRINCNDDLFEELLQKTLEIAKRDQKIDFLNSSKLIGQTLALLLTPWQKMLEFPFVTNWFAVQTAREDVVLHDEECTQRLPFCHTMQTSLESLINHVFFALNTLSSQGDYKLSAEKKRLQVFFDHPEILLRHSSLCFQLLESNVETKCIQEVFETLGIKLNRDLLSKMTDAQVKAINEIRNVMPQQSVQPNVVFQRLTELVQLSLQGDSPAALQHHQTMAVVVSNIVEAMLRLDNQEPILKILWFWRRCFNDDEYSALSQICVLVHAVLQTEHYASNMENLAEFLPHLSRELHPTLCLWYPILADLIIALPKCWINKESFVRFFLEICLRANISGGASEVEKIVIIKEFVKSLANDAVQEEVKERMLELVMSLHGSVPHSREYELALNAGIYVVSIVEPRHAKKFVLDFLHAVDGKGLDKNDYVMVHSVLQLIRLIDHSFATEKAKVLQRYLHILQKSSKEKIIEAVNVFREFMSLPMNTANVIRFLGLIEKDDFSKCHQISGCSSLIKECDKEDLNEFVSFMFTALAQTLCSSENCDSFTKETMKLLVTSTSISAKTCQPILACIAGSIAVGTFDETLNDWAMGSICMFLELYKNPLEDVPSVIIRLYIELIKAFRQIKSIAPRNKAYISNFSNGLKHVLMLPLLPWDIIKLLQSIIELLKQGKIKDEQAVSRIMLHLFKTPGGKTPSIEGTALLKHFEKLINFPLAKKLAEMTVHTKGTVNIEAGVIHFSGPTITLMELLTEKTPLAFAEETSSGLFEYIVERLEKDKTFIFAALIFERAMAIIGNNVTPAEFKREFKNIEEIFHHVPAYLIPLVSKCISECHSVGLTDEQEIRSLILLFLDWNWQGGLLLDSVNASLNSFLNIDKQLVLAFQESSDAERRKNEIKRVLDVVSQLHPVVLYGGVSPMDGVSFEVFQNVAPHDFHMLMRHTLLKPEDVCTALLAYTLSDQFPLVESPFTMDKASLDADTNWSEDYDQSKALTPGKVTYLILQNLRRLKVNDNDVQTETLSIFTKLLGNCSPIPCFECTPQSSTFQDYIAVFACIMKGSSSVEEIKQWFHLSAHHIIVCKGVILEAYSGQARKTEQESLRVSKKILEVLSSMPSKIGTPLCSVLLNEHLHCMANILSKIEDEETVYKLFEFVFVSVRSTATCVDVIAGWNKKESLAFLAKLRERYDESASPVDIERTDNKIVFWLQMLPFVSKAFPNSAKDVGGEMDKMLENHDLDDPQSLGRIPIWFKEMTEAGFSQQVIESWCTSLILYKELSCSDVDAITSLTPSTIQEITKEPHEIEKCLFTINAPKTWTASKESISIDSFKRSLKFAKILNEFTSIAKQFKEKPQVLERIREATHALCSSFTESPTSGVLYKVLDNVPKELFVLLFSEEVGTNEESLSLLTSHSELSESLAVAFRRLARSVQTRPILFGHLKSIVDKIQSFQENTEKEFQTVQSVIHKHILDLEPNQDAMHSLQAAGYNQRSPSKDLWYSSSIKVSSNVPRIVSVEHFCIQRLLVQIWREWRCVLLDLDIQEVEVNGEKIKTTELMNYSDSLATMESQLNAVKKATQDVALDGWSSHRRRQLIQQEKNFRKKMEIRENKVKAGGSEPKMAKLVIIWNNQFLESVRTCSEKIPGCYAPNGFHSEKPVICSLSVDNKIITLFKEGKGGNLTELEDVEVKLFPVGMLVFGVFSSAFSYDTDQLWAAFYKELLLKQLVPKIFLTNVSPGFEWIKTSVKPETTSPKDVTFCRCNSLIPTREDSFDYEPNVQLLKLHTAMADHEMKELIILTPENVRVVDGFTNLQSPNRDNIIRERMERVRDAIKIDSRLQEMHPKSHSIINNRLASATRIAVEITVDGGQPTEENISRFIDLKKLSSGCEDSQEVERNGEGFYSRIILEALQAEVQGNTDECTKDYEFVVNMPDS